MQITTSLMAGVLLLGQAAELPVPSTGDYARIPNAVVYLIDEVQVPARQAGVLKSLALEDGTRIREGTRVTKDMLLGFLDARDALARQSAAELDYQVAMAEREKSEVAIVAAEATVRVAAAESAESVAVNDRVPGAIPKTQMRRQELTEQRASAEANVAKSDSHTAGLTVDLRDAQRVVASINVENHEIRSALDGEVVQIQVHEGEWVNPGEPIMRIVRLDKLRVSGFVKLSEYSPEEIAGADVTIVVNLKQRKERLQSKITYVSPLISSVGDYQVWCEVENKAQNGIWPIQPGMDAEMMIRLNR